jgi:hypothetical protein
MQHTMQLPGKQSMNAVCDIYTQCFMHHLPANIAKHGRCFDLLQLYVARSHSTNPCLVPSSCLPSVMAAVKLSRVSKGY